jgi:hypothetical protein
VNIDNRLEFANYLLLFKFVVVEDDRFMNRANFLVVLVSADQTRLNLVVDSFEKQKRQHKRHYYNIMIKKRSREDEHHHHQQSSSKCIKRDLIQECIRQLPCELLHIIVQFILFSPSLSSTTFNSRVYAINHSKLIRELYIRFRHDENRSVLLLPTGLVMCLSNIFNVFIPVPAGIKRLDLSWDNDCIDELIQHIPAKMVNVSQIHLEVCDGRNLDVFTVISTSLHYYAQRVTSITIQREATLADYEIMTKFPHLKSIKICLGDTKREHFKYLANCTALELSVENNCIEDLFTWNNLKKLTLLRQVVHLYSTSYSVPSNTTIEQLSVSFFESIPHKFAKGLSTIRLKRLQVNMYNPIESTLFRLNWLPYITELSIDGRSTYFLDDCVHDRTANAEYGRILVDSNIKQLHITSNVGIHSNFYAAISKTTTIRNISLHVSLYKQIEHLLIGNNSFGKVTIKYSSLSQATDDIMTVIEGLKQVLPQCSRVKRMEIHMENITPLEIIVGNCVVKCHTMRP